MKDKVINERVLRFAVVVIIFTYAGQIEILESKQVCIYGNINITITGIAYDNKPDLQTDERMVDVDRLNWFVIAWLGIFK